MNVDLNSLLSNAVPDEPTVHIKRDMLGAQLPSGIGEYWQETRYLAKAIRL